jgi:excinuclease ABC subunit C
MLQIDDFNHLPSQTGVYLMKDTKGEVLYIGKALNIQSRIRSHFSAGHAPAELYRRVSSIDFLVTANEVEALLLEISLIKEKRPRFNVQLKDDKRYPFLRLSLDERFPRLYLSRTLPKKGEGRKSRSGQTARFFGPFPHVREARTVLQTLQEVFPLRTCRIPSEDLRLDRPCLEFEMHRCLAPCVQSICGEKEYREVAAEVRKFLDGDHKAVAQDLETRMNTAAAELSFEKAAIYRDALKALQTFCQRQTITLVEEDSEDYIASARLGEVTCVVCLRRRGGSLRGSEHYFLEAGPETPVEEILSAFITQHYESAPEIPRRLLCSEEPGSSEAIEVWLTSLLAKKVEVRRPHRGPRLRLIELARRNAEFHAAEHYRKTHGAKKRIQEAVVRLGADLRLRALPIRIEGFDISHHRGEEPVASMVVFENGAPKKSGYRRFRIKTATGGDDFRSMEEVIGRRFSHEDPDFGPIPDLVLIDGGPVQLEFALKALSQVIEPQSDPQRDRLRQVEFLSLAKREEEVFLPMKKEPLRLDERNPGLKLLQQIRDEAHRFAIDFHRKRKASVRKTSVLADIPGIGPARLQELLVRFGSLERIAETPVDEVASVPGITPDLAQRIVEVCRGALVPKPLSQA